MPGEADRAFLEDEGVSAHFGEIINRVIAEKPQDAYGLIEVLSRLVKEGPPAEVSNASNDEVKALVGRVQQMRTLDKVPANEEGETMEIPCAVPDFVEEAEMFSWAGVGLGEIESYKVMCSMRNMSTKMEAPPSKVRFWGKVLGLDADYYVAEAAGECGRAADGEVEMDPPGQGVNEFAYFVTSDLAGEWLKLPDIKPNEIVAAREIKRVFTGNLQAEVVTHPFFDGPEEVLLRAQIARITADTTLIIKDMLKREDPEDPASAIIQNEEFVMPKPSQLLTPSAWMHMSPHILNSGWTVHKDLPEPDDDPALYQAEVEKREADPPKDVLRDLTEDGLKWVVKQAGDTTLYRNPNDPTGSARCNAVTYVQSLAWPGAVSVSQHNGYANLYIGYGLKAGDPDFFPPAPPDVQNEPMDREEMPEPQGTQESEEPPADE